MKKQKERRRWVRTRLPEPVVAMLYPEYGEEGQDPDPEEKCDTLVACVLDSCGGGLLLESSLLLDVVVKSPSSLART